jgi:anti-anti-sigma factor
MNVLIDGIANCLLLTANTHTTAISIKGSVNFDTFEEIYAFISKILDEYGSRFLILDTSRVEYVSGAGVRGFMSLQDRMKAINGAIVLVDIQEALRRVLGLVGAMEYFILCPSLQDAEEFIAESTLYGSFEKYASEDALFHVA